MTHDRYTAPEFDAAVGAKVGSVNDDEAFSVRHARSRGACPSP